MPTLMSAADVLVQNAGGLSSLEAFACGLPVASYRCIPGHGLTNAAALQEAGLAAWIRDEAALATTLTQLIDGPRGEEQAATAMELFAADPAEHVIRLAGGGSPSPGTPSDAPRAGRQPAGVGMP